MDLSAVFLSYLLFDQSSNSLKMCLFKAPFLLKDFSENEPCSSFFLVSIPYVLWPHFGFYPSVREGCLYGFAGASLGLPDDHSNDFRLFLSLVISEQAWLLTALGDSNK